MPTSLQIVNVFISPLITSSLASTTEEHFSTKKSLLRMRNASYIKLGADVILRDGLALALVWNQARRDGSIHHLHNDVRVALQVHLENLTGIHGVNIVYVADAAGDRGSLAVPKERHGVDKPIRRLEGGGAITLGLEFFADDLREFFELEVALADDEALARRLGECHREKVGAGHFEYGHGAEGKVGQGRKQTHRNLEKQRELTIRYTIYCLSINNL